MALVTYSLTDLKKLAGYLMRDPQLRKYDATVVEKQLDMDHTTICMSGNFSFREAQSTIAVASGENTFTLPDDYDISDPFSLNVYWKEISRDTKLQYIPNKDNYNSTDEGTPKGWYKFAGSGYLYPKVSVGDNLIFQYYKIPQSIIDGTFLIPVSHLDVVAYKTALTLMPQSDSGYSKMQMEYSNKFNDLFSHFIVQQEDNKQTHVADTGYLRW